MIQTATLSDGVTQCVEAAAYDEDIEIRIHWHQPGVNLLGFQVLRGGELVAGVGEMEHE